MTIFAIITIIVAFLGVWRFIVEVADPLKSPSFLLFFTATFIMIMVGSMSEIKDEVDYIEAGAEPVGNSIVVAADGHKPVVVEEYRFLQEPVYIKKYTTKNLFGIRHNTEKYEAVTKSEME